jgi:outer membrane protein assembly factor BamD (BamD/ComL family)
VPTGQKELAELEEMFAQKDYITGLYYMKRGGYDSGIIYFKDVLTKHPASPTARLAQLRLVESYKAIRYKEDAQDVCLLLRKSYPSDAEVQKACGDVPAPSTTTATTPASAPPSATGPPTVTTAPTPAAPPIF